MIYFDNAATTFPKPPKVVEEVVQCLTHYCGNPGRGAHPLALACAERIYTCREKLSDFFGLGAPERIIFTQSSTHAINTVLKGLFRGGEHLLISELEHNAVRRPLCRLRDERQISFDVFPVVGLSEEQLLSGIRARIQPHTAAVVCAHASNICSISLPLKQIGKLCRSRGIKLITDASQSAGTHPIDMREMCIDALAAPGHKGLYGIQGVGVLALGESIRPLPLLEGGSGSDSLSAQMPDNPPERYEAGTLPTPAIVALGAGVDFLQERGMERIAAHERMLFCAARERLEALPGVTVYEREAQGSVLLFHQEGYSCTEVAAKLARMGICVRSGYHCAPMAHQALGTPVGGAVRLSFSAFNTVNELDVLWRTLKS